MYTEKLRDLALNLVATKHPYGQHSMTKQIQDAKDVEAIFRILHHEVPPELIYSMLWKEATAKTARFWPL